MKNLEIHKRAFKNSSVGFISFAVNLLQAFITVPILLSHWGNETYGVWLALFAGFTLFQSADNGHINYVGNKINLLYHYDKEELKNTLSSSLLTAVILGLFQIITVLCLSSFQLLPGLLGVSKDLISHLSIPLSLLILVTGWFISGSFGGILHRLMIPAGYYYQSLWWGILYRISQFITIILIVSLGGSILCVSIFYSMIQLIVYFLTFIYIKNKIPEFYPWWTGANLRTAFLNFRKSLLLTFNNFTQQLSSNGIILFISNMLSSAIVPAFTTIRTITNTASSVSNILINSLLPDIARFHTSKENYKINALFNSHWFFSGIIVNFGLILVLPMIERLYFFWTKGLISFDYTLFISLAASISLINFGSGYNFYLTSINNLVAQTAITVSRVVLIFSCGFYLIQLFGLTGIGLAIMISEIFASMILPFYFVNNALHKLNGNLNVKSYYTAVLPPIIIIVLLIIELLGIEFNYYIWAAALVLTILVYIFNWLILENDIKIRFRDLIRNLFR